MKSLGVLTAASKYTESLLPSLALAPRLENEGYPANDELTMLTALQY